MRLRSFSVTVEGSARGGPALTLTLAPMLAVALALGAASAGCGDRGPKYPSCGSDKDCQEHARDEHCVNRQCRRCAIDRHCKANQTCVDGGCVAPAGSCVADSDCTAGQVCLQGRCRRCDDDAHCGPRRACRAGRCLVRGSCARDDDCADEEDCAAGVCVRPGRRKPPAVGCRLEAVFFAFDRSGLAAGERNLLSRVADCVQSAPGRGVFLNGHTDPRGTEEYNIGLSERRARTVADYLARVGIDPARFRVVPRGETQASGSDESGWARDRRVDIEWQ
jgi:peptidoglycan-associated lipoprotein